MANRSIGKGVSQLVQNGPVGDLAGELDVARREHGDQRGDPGESLGDRVGEDVVPLQLRIAPDLRRLSHQLADPDLQQPVQL